MTGSDRIVGIDGVPDPKAFFTSLLHFYAPVDVILTTWGRLPPWVQERLSSFRISSFFLRRICFHETDWQLNGDSIASLVNCLCDPHFIETFTWGLRKGNTSLGLCHSWDDIYLYSSEFVDDIALVNWIDDLKSKEIVKSYEKIID